MEITCLFLYLSPLIPPSKCKGGAIPSERVTPSTSTVWTVLSCSSVLGGWFSDSAPWKTNAFIEKQRTKETKWRKVLNSWTGLWVKPNQMTACQRVTHIQDLLANDLGKTPALCTGAASQSSARFVTAAPSVGTRPTFAFIYALAHWNPANISKLICCLHRHMKHWACST